MNTTPAPKRPAAVLHTYEHGITADLQATVGEPGAVLPAIPSPPAATGLDVAGFHHDTMLVAGRALLPAALTPQQYTAADYAISEKTARLIEESRPQNTDRNRRNQIRLFETWCADQGRVALPCTTSTLVEYVGDLIDRQLDPDTIAVYKSAVITWQEENTPGNTRPGTRQVTAMIAAYRTKWNRTCSDKQSPAIREVDLELMVAVCDEGGRPADLRDAAIACLGFHLLSRRIELAQLIVSHVTLCRDGIDVRLVDRKSRKDGSVFEAWIPARDDAPHICPVRRVRAWLEYGRLIRQPDDQALFRALDKAGRLAVRLTPQTRPTHPDGTPKADQELTAADWVALSMLSGEALNKFIKALAKQAFARIAHLTLEARVELGHNALIDASTAGKVTAHGLRAGGATELYESGVPEDQIAEMGDWAKGSSAMKRYVRKIEAAEENPWAAARKARWGTRPQPADLRTHGEH
ncbi:tyrosine-type recombinase/integrase [Kitasatospora sp. RG8]|uniref:tyrosine-type recombinase/integrase n=1 Tax=Kitasatospora sp. RG8 TaxID=2820815 RepID=UPI001ADF0052|nr:tyrosine-type recombinase/integrase [Kitasatospora sp. RG8]MBP0454004.1 tyrosine-type recombinase/integrase [Kitasatospora sp. RG8]